MKVFDGHEVKKTDLDNLKYGGYLTLTQAGTSQALINALKIAKEMELTCVNVVNVEDSPITKVGDH